MVLAMEGVNGLLGSMELLGSLELAIVDPDPHNQIEVITKGRCTGECCRMIMVNATPEAIAFTAAWRQLKRRSGNGFWKFAPDDDSEFVAKHFIPVKYSNIHPEAGVRIAKPNMLYRCPFWDGQTKLCTNYDNRPSLCRRHGVEAECSTPGCTLRTAVRLTQSSLDLQRWLDDGGRAG